MDEIGEFAEFLREYIEANAGPIHRCAKCGLLMLDLEVERIRLEAGQNTREPLLH